MQVPLYITLPISTTHYTADLGFMLHCLALLNSVVIFFSLVWDASSARIYVLMFLLKT